MIYQNWLFFHCIVMLCYYACATYLHSSHMHMMMEPLHDIIGKTLEKGVPASCLP